MNKILSVSVAAYNIENFIKTNLDSFVNSEVRDDIEVLVTDDESKDETAKIVLEYEKKYPNVVKLIKQKNAGQAVARNKGIKIAQGKYLFFVDIDDFLVHDAIYKLYEIAIKNDSDYVYGNYYKHYAHKDIVESNYFTNDPKKNAILANFAPWGKLIKKDLITKTHFQFYEGKIFEDIAVIPCLAAEAQNPYYVAEAFYYYNLANTESTIRGASFNPKYADILAVSDFLYNSFYEKNLLKQYYAELEFVFIKGILRSNIFLLAKFKEGLELIFPIRKNVLTKFPNLRKNSYLKKESFKNRFATYICLKWPKQLLYLLKKFW